MRQYQMYKTFSNNLDLLHQDTVRPNKHYVPKAFSCTFVVVEISTSQGIKKTLIIVVVDTITI